ncbi:hypothetical protein J2X97_001375 [Epilithonimonas hungarica]|uniref:hypothetical protein n=1 Tax=Epilithonimonas hungarica TaxID=454006 RepID=UPI002780DF4D|nr:hypothetical protein [Epilithonimonas hungarica]MDP9955738.1 hypothetical protein [Epilithonimonas hungarica]
MERQELDDAIYKKILMSAELILEKEAIRSALIIDALHWLDEIIENEDLNRVTDIHIYEEGFSSTEKKLKNTILHMITSIIADKYTDDNLMYLEEIILFEDNFKSDLSFDYYLKIGGYHTKFLTRILTFTENNINSFTKNKLNATAFYMMKVYGMSSRNKKLFNTANTLHQEKYPSAKNQSTPKVTQKIIKSKPKQWWKFW